MQNFSAKTPLRSRPLKARGVDPLISARECVAMLGCSYSTFRDMVLSGEIKTWRRGASSGKPRGWFRVRLSEIRRVLDEKENA